MGTPTGRAHRQLKLRSLNNCVILRPDYVAAREDPLRLPMPLGGAVDVSSVI
jgi:hypothetical protein